jgi:hypothetical protein
MPDEEKGRELTRSNFSAQMAMLGYEPDGNPKDMVEVVRCKDCVYWDKGHTEQCDNSDSVCFHNGWCQPNWYCADGERKG